MCLNHRNIRSLNAFAVLTKYELVCFSSQFLIKYRIVRAEDFIVYKKSAIRCVVLLLCSRYKEDSMVQ